MAQIRGLFDLQFHFEKLGPLVDFEIFRAPFEDTKAFERQEGRSATLGWRS